MEDTRITFETAKLAKKKGFLKEWADLAYKKDDQKLYGDTGIYTDYPAPTQSLLAKWLREEHEIDILVQRAFSNGIKKYILTPCFDKPIVKGYQSVEKNNYEEAYEVGLQEALKLI